MDVKKLRLQVKSWQTVKMASNFSMKSLDEGKWKERQSRRVKGKWYFGGMEDIFKDTLENQKEKKRQ